MDIVRLTFGNLAAAPTCTSAQILPERGRASQYSINWRRTCWRSSAQAGYLIVAVVVVIMLVASGSGAALACNLIDRRRGRAIFR